MDQYERAARAAGWSMGVIGTSPHGDILGPVNGDDVYASGTSWEDVCKGEGLSVEDNKYSEGARQALVAFQMASGSQGNVESDIRDLFTELFHLVSEQQLDMGKIMTGAVEVFEQEAIERFPELEEELKEEI